MEAIRFKPQSESRFVSNPIAPGVGQINSGILTLSGSIHSRNLTITSIHKVGQTIPGIPGSDDSRNKWVRLFPEYMGEVIPGIGGSEVSGIFIYLKIKDSLQLFEITINAFSKGYKKLNFNFRANTQVLNLGGKERIHLHPYLLFFQDNVKSLFCFSNRRRTLSKRIDQFS